MEYTNFKIKQLLKGNRLPGEEDLLILQPNGTRACAGWELTNGFHLLSTNQKNCELSDEELLKSAYKNLERRNKK